MTIIHKGGHYRNESEIPQELPDWIAYPALVGALFVIGVIAGLVVLIFRGAAA